MQKGNVLAVSPRPKHRDLAANAALHAVITAALQFIEKLQKERRFPRFVRARACPEEAGAGRRALWQSHLI